MRVPTGCGRRYQLFLYQGEDGTFKLKEHHHYHYQVQMQMKFCDVQYCDFVVWNRDSWINQRIQADHQFIDEAIAKVVPFIKLAILPELVGKWYTKQAISSTKHASVTNTNESVPVEQLTAESTKHASPESVEQCSAGFTKPAITEQSFIEQPCGSTQNLPPDHSSSNNCDQWCYCKEDESIDHMIGCDNPNCPIQWFHLSCLHLTLNQVPKGKWFCPECKLKKAAAFN